MSRVTLARKVQTCTILMNIVFDGNTTKHFVNSLKMSCDHCMCVCSLHLNVYPGSRFSLPRYCNCVYLSANFILCIYLPLFCCTDQGSHKIVTGFANALEWSFLCLSVSLSIYTRRSSILYGLTVLSFSSFSLYYPREENGVWDLSGEGDLLIAFKIAALFSADFRKGLMVGFVEGGACVNGVAD